jgi:2',3'-cyclic-nucleotide 2'-phosphodiesterase (5'-nucleotidase family)
MRWKKSRGLPCSLLREKRDVRIYHTSDLHDHVGFAPRLREMRETSPGLLFDCGDSLRGSQTVYHRRERIIGEIDAAGYDVQGLGNREFHYLYGCVKARLAQMQHPVVCSNLVDIKGRALPFQRSLQLEHDGTRVHLLGLLIMQYPVGSAWERVFGWRFLDPVETIREFSADMPEGEPLIVLSHLGLSLDRKLAAAVPRIDLLLGGHSHDTLYQPERVNGVPIVHAGPYGRYVSRSELERVDGRWTLQGFELVPLLDA